LEPSFHANDVLRLRKILDDLNKPAFLLEQTGRHT
jgi:hypothetical protein